MGQYRMPEGRRGVHGEGAVVGSTQSGNDLRVGYFGMHPNGCEVGMGSIPAYTLPSIRAIHQLQGMMMRQMTLPPW